MNAVFGAKGEGDSDAAVGDDVDADAYAGGATSVGFETGGAEINSDYDSDEAADAPGDDAGRCRCESHAGRIASLLKEI